MRIPGKQVGQKVPTTHGIFYVRPLTMGSLLESKKLKNKNSSVYDLAEEAIALTTRDYTGRPLDRARQKSIPTRDLSNIVQAILEDEGWHASASNDPLYSLGSYLRDQIFKLNANSDKLAKSLNRPLVSDTTFGTIGDSVRKMQSSAHAINKSFVGAGSRNTKTAQNIAKYIYSNPREKIPAIPRAPEISHSQRTADAVEASSARLEEMTEHIKSLARETGLLSASVGKAFKEMVEGAQKQQDLDRASLKREKTSLRWAIVAIFVSAALTFLQIWIDTVRDHDSTKHEENADRQSTEQLTAIQDIRNALAPLAEAPSLDFSPRIEISGSRYEAPLGSKSSAPSPR